MSSVNPQHYLNGFNKHLFWQLGLSSSIYSCEGPSFKIISREQVHGLNYSTAQMQRRTRSRLALAT